MATLGRWTALVAVAAVLGLAVPARAYVAVVADGTAGSQNVSSFDTTSHARGQNVGNASTNMLGAAFGPDGLRAYVPTTDFHQLDLVDLDGPTTTGFSQVELGGATAKPRYVAVAPDGTKAYVSDGAGTNDRVLVVDLTGATPAVSGSFAVGSHPEGVAFTPDGTRAFVANGGDGTVTPVTTATNTPGAPITVGVHPAQIAVKPDGTTAYVTDNGSDKVYPITVATGAVGSAITVGTGPVGIAITPDGTRAYVANNGPEASTTGTGSTVTPITLSTNTPGTAITVGPGPWAVAVTPDSHTAFVTNQDPSDSNIVPIDVATNTAGPAFQGGGIFPRSIAITPDVAPVAGFTASGSTVDEPTSFDASASTVRYGSIATYAWDFGDGATATTAGPTTTHTYAQPGDYTASVTETDSAGTSVGGTVYTGTSPSRVGGPSAHTTRAVHIAIGPSPQVSLSASSVDFGAVTKGTPSSAKTVTVTNTGDAPLSIASVQITGAADFARGDDSCAGATVAPTATCQTAVMFTPGVTGTRSAQLAFTDNATGSPHTVALTGTGADPPPPVATVTITPPAPPVQTGTVTGTVLNGVRSGSPPVVGARVTLCAPFARICTVATTAGDGGYAFASVPVGRYVVDISPPTGSDLENGARAVRVLADETTDATTTLNADQPVPASVPFTSPFGEQTGHPTLYWDAPFEFSVPIAPTPARGTPGSSVTTSVIVEMKTAGTHETAVGSVLSWRIGYDDAGRPQRATVINHALPATSRATFDVDLGGTVVAHDDVLETDPDRLAAAQRITLRSTGFHGAVHGRLTLRVVPHRDTTLATARDAPQPRDIGPASPAACQGAQEQLAKDRDTERGAYRELERARVELRFATDPAAQVSARVTFELDVAKAAVAAVTVEIDIDDVNEKCAPDPDACANAKQAVFDEWDEVDQKLKAVELAKVDLSFAKGAAEVDAAREALETAERQLRIAEDFARSAETFRDSEACPPPDLCEPLDPADAKLVDAYDKTLVCGDPGQVAVDPSGFVVTRRGVPLERAKVTLERSDTAAGHFRAPPDGDPVMAADNRRNPDRTDRTGHFGWNVFPGFYRVRATHPSCRGTAVTKARQVPPPVTDLRLVLRCPGLRRTATATRITSVRRRATGSVASVRVRPRHGHRRVAGLVTLSVRGHQRAFAFARNGRARITVPGRLPARFAVRFAGDARLAPSRART